MVREASEMKRVETCILLFFIYLLVKVDIKLLNPKGKIIIKFLYLSDML